MKRIATKLMVALVVAGLVATFGATAWADDGDSITAEVRYIAASADGDEVDGELTDIENRLRRGFTDYSSFRHLDRESRTIAIDESSKFELPTGEDVLVLTFNEQTDDFIHLGLELENRLSTTLRATPGSTFFQAGLTYEESTLVLAITVE